MLTYLPSTAPEMKVPNGRGRGLSQLHPNPILTPWRMTLGRIPLSDNSVDSVCVCMSSASMNSTVDFHIDVVRQVFWNLQQQASRLVHTVYHVFLHLYASEYKKSWSEQDKSPVWNKYFMMTKRSGPTWSRKVDLTGNAELQYKPIQAIQS